MTTEYPHKGPLAGVFVAVEPLNPHFAQDITAEVLQSAIETRLNDGGIRILTERETVASPGAPLLSLGLIAISSPDFHIYGMQVAFYQQVYVARYAGANLRQAITWRSSLAVGAVQRPEQVPYIIPQVVDLVEEFIHAWVTDDLENWR